MGRRREAWGKLGYFKFDTNEFLDLLNVNPFINIDP